MKKVIIALFLASSFQAYAIEKIEIPLANSSDSMRLFRQLSLANVPSVDENSNSVFTRAFTSSDSAMILSCSRTIAGVLETYACALNLKLDSEENTATSVTVAPTGALVAKLNDADSDKLFAALVGLKRYSTLEKISVTYNGKVLVVPRLSINCPSAIISSGVSRTGLCQVVSFK